MRRKVIALLSLFVFVPILTISCKGSPTVTTTSTPTTNVTYSLSELKYQLLAVYSDYFWCDPDFYPVARPGTEQQNAINQFAAIRANREEFAAILSHLNLPDKTDYTDAEKLQIYREHKILNDALQVMPAAYGYTFTILTGQNDGKMYQGTVSATGSITVTDETTSLNTCPICLKAGTLIDTPEDSLPVEQLRTGMIVYTVDTAGNKITGVITATASVTAPSSFKITTIVLDDGRSVSASPGHPTTDNRAVGELKDGETIDGGTIVSVTSDPYNEATYDILPEGGTGFYWANGILLKSTLAK